MCLSLILQKELANGYAQPTLNVIKNKINSPSHMVPEKSDKTLASDKQRRRGMFSFLYGSRSSKLCLAWEVSSCLLPVVEENIHLSKLILHLYMFLKSKSSNTWLIPAFLYKGPIFYFYVESVFLSYLYLHKQTLDVNPGYKFVILYLFV